MLSANEKNELAKIYNLTCKSFDKDLSIDVIKLQIDDLAEFSYNEIVNALNLYRKEKKNKFWPKASDIAGLIMGDLSDESIGRDTSARIIAAIPHYGYNNGLLAKDYIGEFGWNIVKRLGGWAFLCENLGITLNNSALAAQIRDLATDQSLYGAIAIKEKVDNLHLESKHNISADVLKLVNIKAIE